MAPLFNGASWAGVERREPVRPPVPHDPAGATLVEMVGPAACGKTTLARALVAALQARGRAARLAASARPSEGEDDPRGWRTGAGPLLAPASRMAKAAALAPTLAGRPSAQRSTREILGALPPRSFMWELRYRRYLDQLGARWEEALAFPGATVFDQGFLSAVASLAALGRALDVAACARALDAAPRPDLAVRLDAPLERLEHRLTLRLRAQGPVERLLEPGPAAAPAQLAAFEALDVLLERRALRVLRLSVPDLDALPAAVARIEHEIAALRGETET
ncbi:AAA family ATPase [Albimonas pacifica]|uniref:AAA domain-containing protein n=1 Tax=Albimonas pacifica TaxID=1114924 RepID=A0A1I3IXF6_9RHOB|nr:AAA family ATPase [Albimonas pacifica]SFI52545.1 AAA domain-containing protein [Albimonas pacifica]